MKYYCEQCGAEVEKVRDFNVYAVKKGIRLVCKKCFMILNFGEKKELKP